MHIHQTLVANFICFSDRSLCPHSKANEHTTYYIHKYMKKEFFKNAMLNIYWHIQIQFLNISSVYFPHFFSSLPPLQQDFGGTPSVFPSLPAWQLHLLSLAHLQHATITQMHIYLHKCYLYLFPNITCNNNVIHAHVACN